MKGPVHKGRTEDRQQGREGIWKGRIQGILLPVRPAGASSSANAVEEEDEEEAVLLGRVWTIGAEDEYEDENPWVMVKDKWLAKSANAKQDVEVRNWFEVLAVETDKDRKMTRTSAIELNVAEVRKPLASAARWVKSGNRVVLDQDDLVIEHLSTGERMKVRVKDETFVLRMWTSR